MRFFLLLAAIFGALPSLFATVTPENVVVVVNRDDIDSLEIARHYIKARNIPEKNLIEMSLSHNEEITWEVFQRTIWNPLLKELIKREWLTGTVKPDPDKAGRQRLVVGENKIGYLVLCRGVPLRIANSAEVLEQEALRNINEAFAVTTASVDSELTLLAHPDSTATALVQNPSFNKKALVQGAGRKEFICVARLDGPSRSDCQRMVDNAILAEQKGLLGRAYIDCGGPHPQGDAWLKETGKLLGRLGYDLTLDETPALLGYDTRFDAPAFYFGWYSGNVDGRLADPSLRFPPGAIALHIHSFSAVTTRSFSQGWVGPLVGRGVPLTLGSVAEPELQFTTIPPLMLAGLIQGMQAGEAYMLATPAFSWQTILVGDPLYRPFKYNLKSQLVETSTNETPLLFYACLREANLLKAENKNTEAAQVIALAAQKYPGLSAQFALAKDSAGRGAAWSWPDDVGNDNDDIGLQVEIARFLKKEKKLTAAVSMYRRILDKHAKL
ncbi:MAG: TIGR03790 family protein, partial [Puniceicoccales bacterium]|nr:TIGR03790 family protein [Puniceicoccales bacterium]